MPLGNLLGPVGNLYCFSNTFRMLVTLTVNVAMFNLTHYASMKAGHHVGRLVCQPVGLLQLLI